MVTAAVALPVLPAASPTRTSKLWAPSDSAAGVCEVAVVHGAKPAVSTRHSIVVGAPAVVKVNVGVVSLLGEAGGAIATVGATVSTVQARSAGVGSRLPEPSRTRTRKRWSPSARPVRLRGEVHAASAAASSAQSKVAPLPASGDEKSKRAVVADTAPVGPMSMRVSGVDESMVQAWLAGAASALPARSVARTARVWAPSSRLATSKGEAHGTAAAPSTAQVKVASSEAWNSKRTAVLLSSAGGTASKVVSGATVSTRHAWVAGVASGTPSVLVATTSNRWGPSATGTACGEVHGAAAAPSRRQAKVDGRSATNSKRAVAWLLSAAGVAVSVVWGSAPAGASTSPPRRRHHRRTWSRPRRTRRGQQEQGTQDDSARHERGQQQPTCPPQVPATTRFVVCRRPLARQSA